jgi:hypothetical protein
MNPAVIGCCMSACLVVGFVVGAWWHSVNR